MNVYVTAFTESKKLYYIINNTVLRADLLQCRTISGVSIEICAWLSVVRVQCARWFIFSMLYLSVEDCHIFLSET